MWYIGCQTTMIRLMHVIYRVSDHYDQTQAVYTHSIYNICDPFYKLQFKGMATEAVTGSKFDPPRLLYWKRMRVIFVWWRIFCIEVKIDSTSLSWAVRIFKNLTLISNGLFIQNLPPVNTEFIRSVKIILLYSADQSDLFTLRPINKKGQGEGG